MTTPSDDTTGLASSEEKLHLLKQLYSQVSHPHCVPKLIERVIKEEDGMMQVIVAGLNQQEDNFTVACDLLCALATAGGGRHNQAMYQAQSTCYMPALIRALSTARTHNEDMALLQLVAHVAADIANAQRMMDEYPELLRLVYAKFTAADVEEGSKMSSALPALYELAGPLQTRRVMLRDFPLLFSQLAAIVAGGRLFDVVLSLKTMARLTHRSLRLPSVGRLASVDLLPVLLHRLVLAKQRRGGGAHEDDDDIQWCCLELIYQLAHDAGDRAVMVREPKLVLALVSIILPYIPGAAAANATTKRPTKQWMMETTAAVNCLAALAKDAGFALEVFKWHFAALRPLLYECVSLGHDAEAPLRMAAAALLYALSCPAANQSSLRDDEELVSALRLESNSMCKCEDRFLALFTLINLYKAVDMTNNNNSRVVSSLSLEYDADLISAVHWALARELTVDDPVFLFSQALFAVRSLSASEACRRLLWNMYGVDGGIWDSPHQEEEESDIPALVPLLVVAWVRATEWQMVDAVEHCTAILVQFSGDQAGPRLAMRRELKLITRLVEQLDAGGGGASSTTATKAGHFLLRRLAPVQGEEEEAAVALSPAPRRQLTKRDVAQLLVRGQWDRFIQEAASVQNDHLYDVLHQAILKAAPLRVIDYLVRTRMVDVNQWCMASGLSYPLSLALQGEQAEVAMLLLDFGADIHAVDHKMMTPLICSCESEVLLPVTRRLVEMSGPAGSNQRKWFVNQKISSSDGDGDTALLYCTCQGKGMGHEQIKVLLEAGASPNARGNGGFSPLVLAMRWPDVPMCRLLLKHGADPGYPSRFARDVFHEIATALDIKRASEDELVALLDLLVDENLVPAHSRPKRTETAGSSTSSSHAGRRDAAFVPVALLDPFVELVYDWLDVPLGLLRRWLQLGADPNVALQLAMRRGLPHDVALLLQAGADPNFRLDRSSSAATSTSLDAKPKSRSAGAAATRLAILAGWEPGRPELLKAVERGEVDQVKLLLQAGVLATGKPSLFEIAMKHGHDDLLPLLVTNDDRKKYRGEAPAKQTPGGFDEGHQGGGGFGFTFTMCAYCRQNRGVLNPCAGCIMVAYCDEECQRAHWSAKHKQVCKKKRAMDKTRRAASTSNKRVDNF